MTACQEVHPTSGDRCVRTGPHNRHHAETPTGTDTYRATNVWPWGTADHPLNEGDDQ